MWYSRRCNRYKKEMDANNFENQDKYNRLCNIWGHTKKLYAKPIVETLRASPKPVSVKPASPKPPPASPKTEETIDMFAARVAGFVDEAERSNVLSIVGQPREPNLKRFISEELIKLLYPNFPLTDTESEHTRLMTQEQLMRILIDPFDTSPLLETRNLAMYAKNDAAHQLLSFQPINIPAIQTEEAIRKPKLQILCKLFLQNYNLNCRITSKADFDFYVTNIPTVLILANTEKELIDWTVDKLKPLKVRVAKMEKAICGDMNVCGKDNVFLLSPAKDLIFQQAMPLHIVYELLLDHLFLFWFREALEQIQEPTIQENIQKMLEKQQYNKPNTQKQTAANELLSTSAGGIARLYLDYFSTPLPKPKALTRNRVSNVSVNPNPIDSVNPNPIDSESSPEVQVIYAELKNLKYPNLNPFMGNMNHFDTVGKREDKIQELTGPIERSRPAPELVFEMNKKIDAALFLRSAPSIGTADDEDKIMRLKALCKRFLRIHGFYIIDTDQELEEYVTHSDIPVLFISGNCEPFLRKDELKNKKFRIAINNTFDDGQDCVVKLFQTGQPQQIYKVGSPTLETLLRAA